MNPDMQLLVGLWDVHSGLSISQLLLQPDGSYSHTRIDHSQSHWGTWSVQFQQGQHVLMLALAGAQPMFMMGPLGPQPINWPAAEVWPITNVQTNQVTLWGAILLRHAVAAGTEPFPPTTTPYPQFVPAPQQHPYGDFPNPMTQPPLPQGYASLPLLPPSPVLSAAILSGWQNLSIEEKGKLKDMAIATYKDDRQTDIDISSAKAQMDQLEFDAREKIIRDKIAANHDNAAAFMKKMFP